MDNHIEVVAAAACVLSNETLRVGLIDGSLQLLLLVPELTTNVDVSCFGAHAKAHNQGAFDELVRVVAQDLAVLASAGFGLIRVDDEVGWSIMSTEMDGIRKTEKKSEPQKKIMSGRQEVFCVK